MIIIRTFDLFEHLMDGLKRDDALAGKRNGRWEYFRVHQYKDFAD